MTTAQGKNFPVVVVKTGEAMAQGLSGKRPKDWPKGRGMLFAYSSERQVSFWMPDTYMDLDLFFLDSTMKVTRIIRRLKAHPGHSEPPVIPRTPRVKAQYVLELRSDSPLARGIKVRDKLVWKKSQ